MNDAEKESIDKIAKDFVRKASSLGAYEEAHLGEDENNEPLYGDYLKLEKELADILIAKEDEIERLKEENGILSSKADDANKLCSEKHDFMLSQFKKKDEQIERLKNKLSDFNDVIIPAWKKDEADWIEERKTLTAKLVEAEKERDVWKKEPWYDFTSRLQEENQQLTARNKELELALSGRTVSCEACNGMAEKVKELEAENQNFKDCYGGQCISCDVRFGSTEQSLIFKFKKTKEELESKLAVAREALSNAVRSVLSDMDHAIKNKDSEYVEVVQRRWSLIKQALAELGEK